MAKADTCGIDLLCLFYPGVHLIEVWPETWENFIKNHFSLIISIPAYKELSQPINKSIHNYEPTSWKHIRDRVRGKVYRLYLYLAMFQAINFDFSNPQKTQSHEIKYVFLNDNTILTFKKFSFALLCWGTSVQSLSLMRQHSVAHRSLHHCFGWIWPWSSCPLLFSRLYKMRCIGKEKDKWWEQGSPSQFRKVHEKCH